MFIKCKKAFIFAIIFIPACASQPITKSSNYSVSFMSHEIIDQKGGKFVVAGKVKGNYEVLKIGDSFQGEIKQAYYQGNAADVILWVNGAIVSPYLITPNSGEGQYDSDEKSFLCFKSYEVQSMSVVPQPNPCWSPLVEYTNPLYALTSAERKFKKIDEDEVIKVVEQSKLFAKLANPALLSDFNTIKKSYLVLKRSNRTAAVTQVDNYLVTSSDEILELEPGRHVVSMYCMLNPNGHGSEKGKKEVQQTFNFLPGHYKYIKDGRGIAMVGLVCSPQLGDSSCRANLDRCKKK